MVVPHGFLFFFCLVWLPALCRLRQEGFDPHPIPPLLFFNLLIYKTNSLSACQGAWLASLAHKEGADRVLVL